MADVLLDDVSRVFPDGFAAVSHLSLHVRDAALLTIVGHAAATTTRPVP